jgi:hypothetical protein
MSAHDSLDEAFDRLGWSKPGSTADERRKNFIDGLEQYISQLEAVPGNSTLTMMLRGLMKAHGVGSAS